MPMKPMDRSMTSETEQEDEGGVDSPLDAIIAKVDGYIQNPKTATPDTLAELKQDLMDVKSYYDEDQEPEEDDGMDEEQANPKGLAIMIGMGKGRK